MRFSIAILATFLSVTALASSDQLFGTWEGGDTASMSIYGKLTITEDTIEWGGCVVEYEMRKEAPGIEFKNQTGRKFVTGTIETYVLELKRGNCANNLSAFRFTFDLPKHPTYLAMVEYSADGSPVGYMHFHKR